MLLCSLISFTLLSLTLFHRNEVKQLQNDVSGVNDKITPSQADLLVRNLARKIKQLQNDV
jgi:hypothetical protein